VTDWAAAIRSLPTSRTCGNCDLCCTALHVEELHKPAGMRCRHLSAFLEPGGNCLIYRQRPASCGAFICLWRGSDTVLPWDFFPASSGFCLSINDPTDWPTIIKVNPDPKRPTSWDQPHYRARFAELAFDLNCIVVVGEGVTSATFFTPNGKVYSKADDPELFSSDNGVFQIPDGDFREGVRLTPVEIAEYLYGAAQSPE